LFVFDLDGTLAQGTARQMNDVVQLSKSRSAVIAYATGRSLDEVGQLQRELDNKLPTPDCLIANNGGVIYYNLGGIWAQDNFYKTDYKKYNKASGVDYLKKLLDITPQEILTAGNDNTDISLAQLSNNGSKFICVNNASNRLKKVCAGLGNNIYISVNNGAKGIIEGIKYFIEN
jgi:hydroxymethylpyrimidine pyrophosphatase-like HAD family hydrolase